ncbi:hypothetical protein H0H92_010416 [Tricholoma furcatifolium]|nr:hypothetical protein H0H92_010416 [Tricholoma furcatifolium]
MASILVDQISTSLLVDGEDSEGSSSSFVGGTALIIPDESRNHPSLSFDFNGTAAVFYGSFTPLNITIDGMPESVTNKVAPTDIIELSYATPMLSDGTHTINITFISNGCVLDYMVVTAAYDTLLTGQTLIVDDDDPLFSYEGTWAKNTTTLLDDTSDVFERVLYGSGMHQSSSTGSVATLSFNGTSVSVYGVATPSNTVQISYSMDGETPFTLAMTRLCSWTLIFSGIRTLHSRQKTTLSEWWSSQPVILTSA